MASSRRANGRIVRAKAPVSRAGLRRNGSKSPALPSSPASPAVPQKVQQQLIETITSAVTNGRTPEEVADACLRVFIEMTEAQGAAVYLLDELTKSMRCV